MPPGPGAGLDGPQGPFRSAVLRLLYYTEGSFNGQRKPLIQAMSLVHAQISIFPVDERCGPVVREPGAPPPNVSEGGGWHRAPSHSRHELTLLVSFPCLGSRSVKLGVFVFSPGGGSPSTFWLQAAGFSSYPFHQPSCPRKGASAPPL